MWPELIGIIALYTVLFLCSYNVRLYSKILIPHLMLTISGLLALPFGLVLPKNYINLRILSFFMYYISKYLSDLKWDMRGIENMKLDGPAIIVANHQSALDGLGCGVYWYMIHPATIITKRALMFFGPIGWSLFLGGAVHIDRANTGKAKEIIEARLKALVDKKTKVLFFPEGTRNYSGDSLLPFKKGAFHLAVKFQLPIIPLVYSTQKVYYDADNHFWLKEKLIIQALPAISTKGLTSADVDDLTTSVREIMLTTFKELSMKS